MEKSKNSQKLHKPVLKEEAVTALQVSKYAHLKNHLFVDATLGYGGHTEEIIKRGGRVLGIDADKEVLEVVQKRVKKACPVTFKKHEGGCFTLVHDNFRNIDKIVGGYGNKDVVGVLFDLGVSSVQLTSKNRGFSFQETSSFLDMRIDSSSQALTAADLLNVLNKKQLSKVFGSVLPHFQTKRLVNNIILEREFKRIETVGDFLEVIKKTQKKNRGLNLATLEFLALRIAVNSELENVKDALPKAFGLLTKGGRLVVISFHSGEDVIVKGFYKSMTGKNEAKIINKRPITPSKTEIERNPRSRSAKMRVLEKI